MASEPGLYLGMLMRRVVVSDQVQFKLGRNISVEMLQKAQEFLMAMAWLALGDDPPVDDIERREERRGAVAKVVVSHPLDITESHRQHWLGALQGLHLALLVHAQDKRVIRRIKIKANDVPNLFDEERVGGQLEALAAMWLQPEQRATVLLEMPVCAATLRTLQWVATAGLLCSTLRNKAATCSSLWLRGRPGRSSACNPATPLC
jgi:hypothetical protein